MYDVFISYARDDKERAAEFQRAITNAGWSVWWDAHLLPGQQWNDEIERELRAAGAVVVLWSKKSVNSQFVCDEATIARELGKLVPVTLDGQRPKVGMGQLQLENMSTWDGKASDHPGLVRVLAGIRHIVKPRGGVISEPPRGPAIVESGGPTGSPRSSSSKVPLIAGAAVIGLLGIAGFVALPYLRDTPRDTSGASDAANTPPTGERTPGGTLIGGPPISVPGGGTTPAGGGGSTSKRGNDGAASGSRVANGSTTAATPTRPAVASPPPAMAPTTAAAAAAAPGPSVDRGCTSLTSATRKDPDNSEGFFDLGKCHYDEGRYSDAVAAYNAAINVNANIAKYFEGRGLAKWKNSLAPQGIADLDSAIALKPRDANLYESRGQIHLAMRKWQLAMDDYDKATRINPKSKRAWLGLAEAAENNGSPEIAESAKAQASALP